MNALLHRRRHRFDALFELLTGRSADSGPQRPDLPRDIRRAYPRPGGAGRDSDGAVRAFCLDWHSIALKGPLP